MALKPDNNQSFYREVDEELRRERIGSFWERFGKLLLGLLALLLIAGIGYAVWRTNANKAAAAEGELLDKALSDLGEGKEAGVAAPLAKLATSKNAGYRASALLTQADLALGKGDVRGAAAGYARIANDAGLPQPHRDLGVVRQTAAEFDAIAPALVISRLTPLAKPGSPWFGTAGEMVGAAYLKQNKPQEAAKLFAAIAKDDGVPETIRSRAVQMASTLGIDAIPEDVSAAQDKAGGNATATRN